MMGRKLLAVIIWLALCQPALAATLNVNSATGNDSNTYAQVAAGTHQWATIGRAAWGSTTRSSPNASEAAQAGDTVLIAAGTYSASASSGTKSECAYNPANSGTSGSPITFRGVGTVILQSTVDDGPVIGAYGRDYIIWDNFYVDEDNVSTVSDTGPVVIWGNSSPKSIGNQLRNIEINAKCANWVDNHCGIRLEYTTYATVYNCKIYGVCDGNNNYGENSAGIMLYDSDYNTIEHNEIYNCGNGVFIKGIHGVSQTGNIVRYNLFYSNENAGVEITGSDAARVYQNVFRDNAHDVWQWAINADYNNNWVVNNTFIRASSRSILVKGDDVDGFDGGRWWNNITHSAPIILYDVSFGAPYNVSHEHNNYYGFTAANFWVSEGPPAKTFAQWKTDSGEDAASPASITTDPLLASVSGNDFRLCTGSGTPVAGCSGASPALTLGVDILDLDGDSDTTDTIPAGAYITGSEVIGITTQMDSTAYGHVTGVTQPTTATFVSAWSGNGTITGSGDEEVITVTGTQYMATGVLNTGVTKVTLSQNLYRSGDTTVMKWRTCATDSTCTGAWTTYSAPFDSLGYIQLRVEAP